jgi:lipid-binding SYLF domain-containing protein
MLHPAAGGGPASVRPRTDAAARIPLAQRHEWAAERYSFRDNSEAAVGKPCPREKLRRRCAGVRKNGRNHHIMIETPRCASARTLGQGLQAQVTHDRVPNYLWSPTMIISRAFVALLMLAFFSLVSAGFMNDARGATAEDLDKDSRQALQILYKATPFAKTLSHSAKAVLVFPKVIKAGLVFGGSYGEGELLRGSKVDGYYNTVTGSWGLQAGAQSYGYVVFLMTENAVQYLSNTQGWEIGVGPTVVLVDEGVAKNLSTSTLKDDAYAFVFDQQGLMAGVSIEGTKISRIKR